jgi:hypothetical protein
MPPQSRLAVSLRFFGLTGKSVVDGASYCFGKALWLGGLGLTFSPQSLA